MLPQVRQRFLASRTALRYVLGQTTRQSPAELVFAYGPYGKPWLPQAPQVQFNLSHSEGLGLLAIAPCAIGVDVERLDRKLDPLLLAQRFFPAAEASYLAQLDAAARQSAFLRSWVMKEALLKATGQGLAGQLTELDFDHGQRMLRGSDSADWHFQLLEVDGAIAAVASVEPAVLDLRNSPLSIPGNPA
jgi:4'-phosphopantetheinyl transferase